MTSDFRLSRLFYSYKHSSPAIFLPHFPPSTQAFAKQKLRTPRIAATAALATTTAAMRTAAVLLMALALTLAAAGAGAELETAAVVRRRQSRFLASAKNSPPLSYYDCKRKPPSVCREPGSPGATCCKGACVDTESSFAHCGSCNHVCKYGETCCGGHCVDLLSDGKNCGDCFVRCPSKKCSFGLCDYAG
ncbi:stigma-specific STIG1-like protein 3 [Oryza glaberrima]|nr:stigma-specific STIG1-like protein 3 [Oryza glaberrima]